MADNFATRFDAETVAKTIPVNGERRLEIKFGASGGQSLVVSVPLHEAVALARLICDAYEETPFLGPAVRRAGTQAK